MSDCRQKARQKGFDPNPYSLLVYPLVLLSKSPILIDSTQVFLDKLHQKNTCVADEKQPILGAPKSQPVPGRPGFFNSRQPGLGHKSACLTKPRERFGIGLTTNFIGPKPSKTIKNMLNLQYQHERLGIELILRKRTRAELGAQYNVTGWGGYPQIEARKM